MAVNSPCPYAVVEFSDENSSGVIPTTWLIDQTTCRYPKVAGFKVTKFIRERTIPPNNLKDDNWETHKVRVFTYTDTYEKGKSKADNAVYTSNVESEVEEDRVKSKKARNRLVCDSSSDDGKPSSKRKRNTNKQVSRALFLGDKFTAPNTPLIPETRQSGTTSNGQSRIPKLSSPSFCLAPGSGRLNQLPQLTAIPTQSDPVFPVTAHNNQIANDSPVATRTPVTSQLGPHVISTTPKSRFFRSSEPSQLPPSVDITKFQSTVLRALTVIQQDIKQLMIQTSPTVNVADDLGIPVSIPLTSVSDFNLLNEWLFDKSNRVQLVTHLKLIGGGSLESVVRGILLRLIGPTLNILMNYSGKFNKTKLHGTLIHTTILEATRMNNLGRAATDSEVKSLIQKWLNGVNDRDGGRSRRRRNEVSQNSAP